LGALAKGAQNGSKKWVFFPKGYNEFAFLCNWTDWHEILAKTSVAVIYRTLIEEFQNFSLKGVILCQNCHFSAVFLTGLHLTCLQRAGYVSGLCRPSIY